MLVLGLDTATPYCGVAIADDRKILGENGLELGKRHQEQLVPLVQRLMGDLSLTWASLDGVAISAGPGSFTGLRVGLGVAKGFCFATGAALLLIPTLDAFATYFPFVRYPVCPMLDARKGEVYAGLYDTSTGAPVHLSAPLVLPPENMLRQLQGPTLLFGTGAVVYREMVLQRLGEEALFPPYGMVWHCADAVALLGVERLRRGERDDLATAEPFYLRKSEAEVKQKVRL
ncbi:MAG: tRNA (adenosine(37)-N6)-threonylcarbamoyltransferase complex dimerization subunit type 1 TsaB [Candidatus Latescibacteria bacterium]|nr:tRNA (adenosine(37)-N6)-threonylcarbamoyltransferase complex dimerization subunit type 1 TsaB [Candidatus Latescibacterota bacterium]